MRRWDVVAGAVAVVALLAASVQFVIGARILPERMIETSIVIAVCTPAVVLGVLIARRRPRNVVGVLLMLVGAGPLIDGAVASWSATATTSTPLPGAAAIAPIAEGTWMLSYVGALALALFFPTGRLLSPRWRIAVVGIAVIPLAFVAVLALAPVEIADVLVVVLVMALLALLIASVSSVVLRYRRGDDELRRQVRWLTVSAILAPAALLVCVAGWALWQTTDLVGLVLAVLVVALPVSVAVAMLRHRLYGYDRLLSGTVRWALLVAALGVVFAAVALVLGLVLGGPSPIVAAVATLAAAVAFGPLRRWLRRVIDARFQPRRERLLAAVRAFVVDVRDGRAAPEELEDVLQQAGGVAGLTPSDLRDLSAEARLPLELARLRSDLRASLEQTDASRARLVKAADDERRRIQRDLHDGAQSNLVALGMRLRQLQRASDDAGSAELGEAVELVQRTISDLRALAQGVRPSSLDEGLEPALRAMVRSVPLPVALELETIAVAEPTATAAYYVAAEAVTNTLKHARASRIGITLSGTLAGIRLLVEDDGGGGASEGIGSGLAGIRDRVEAAGGRLSVASTPGTGTRVEAVFP